MPQIIDTLRNLHNLHQCLSDLRNRLARGPKQIVAREANVTRLEKAFAQAVETATQTRIAIDRKQLDLKSNEGRISDWKLKLNACGTNKEYQAFIEQIAAAEMANSVLEDEILEGLDKIETTEAAAGKAEQVLEKTKEDLERFRRQFAEEAETIRNDILAFEQRLTEAERNLQGQISTDYQRLVKAKGADGLAPVDENVCTGCGHQMTLNMQNDMQLDKVNFCKGCGRLLYLPE